jgi:hypothetical protein
MGKRAQHRKGSGEPSPVEDKGARGAARPEPAKAAPKAARKAAPPVGAKASPSLGIFGTLVEFFRAGLHTTLFHLHLPYLWEYGYHFFSGVKSKAPNLVELSVLGMGLALVWAQGRTRSVTLGLLTIVVGSFFLVSAAFIPSLIIFGWRIEPRLRMVFYAAAMGHFLAWSRFVSRGVVRNLTVAFEAVVWCLILLREEERLELVKFGGGAAVGFVAIAAAERGTADFVRYVNRALDGAVSGKDRGGANPGKGVPVAA